MNDDYVNITDTRRRNLRRWIDTRYEGSQARMIDHVGINQGELSGLLRSKSFGEKKARSLEQLAGMPLFFLDEGEGLGQHKNVHEGLVHFGKIPLISWVRAGDFCEAADPFEPGDADEWLPKPSNAGDKSYALRIRGDSMTAPFPGVRSYPDGTVIFVDPAQEVLPGQRGIFKLPDSNEVTFKELVSDAGIQFLKPLNPQYSNLPVTDGMMSCGKVVGSYMTE